MENFIFCAVSCVNSLCKSFDDFVQGQKLCYVVYEKVLKTLIENFIFYTVSCVNRFYKVFDDFVYIVYEKVNNIAGN